MFAFLAAATPQKLTVWEKVLAIPGETWLNLGILIVVGIVLAKVWKTLRDVNEIVPWIAFITLGGTLMLYWTYERKEPKVLSPIFDQLGKVFPSKINYDERQNKPVLPK